ncbi:hypothetical protein I3F58_00585 [Streptomyces sp. MUM 203J]|uniref:hypothetical protein n=1 Tax=Streptomyces sp. MUM 203J TaxID=2791990 RepID=UPI001F047D29|nr:hypothetical protein [Streptomyces sp. MUM 203J]MCH0538080.1 hypothetical protein [Streptomyces sp. MUM 203J]
MTESHPTYVELGYGEDFGLTGLTERLCSLGRRPDLADALDAVACLADQSDGEEAVELGEDARRLLESPLPDEVVHMVWLAVVGRCFDPADHGLDIRAWLRRLSELATERLRRNRKSYVPPPVRPVRDEEFCHAVVAEIRDLAPTLGLAAGLPDLATGLQQVVTRADADLGFRLFVRSLKTYSVRVGKERYDRFLGLAERFGYPAAVVYDGLNVVWPPVDTARRDATWDFGLSRLAARFAGAWHSRTARDIVQKAAGVGADAPDRTPGSEAAVLLEDTLRLLESVLSTDAITTLWVAASDRGFGIDHLGIDGRDWLREIAEVCEEVLRDAAPTYTAVVLPVPTDLAEEVLSAVREVAPLVTDKAVSPTWKPIPATTVLAAVEQVVTRVDPDLGFRLFLRVLLVLSVPLTEEQYSRYEFLGGRFGYGEYHLLELDQLVRSV